MWKLIAVVGISSPSLALAALPAFAACSSSQVNLCTNENNACADDCNFTGAPTTMSGRLVEPAWIAVPLLGKGLDSDAIMGDVQISSALREGLAAFVRAIGTRENPGEEP